MRDVNPTLLLTILSASLAGLLFGINTANITGALPFVQQYFATTTMQNEIIVSSTIFFAFLNAMFSATLTSKFGHRNVLILTGFFYILGALQSYFAESLYSLICSRALLGVAIGISSYTAPIYIAEFSPVELRGFFVLINGIAITGGQALAFYLDYCFASQHWQAMLGWGVIPGIVFTSAMLYMPHSKPITTKLIISWRKIFSKKSYRRPIFIAVALGVLQQLFGVNAILYYGPFVFSSAGFALTNSALGVTFVMGLINLITTIATGWFVDRMGRRFLLLLGSSLAFLSLLIIALLFKLSVQNSVVSISIVICMVTYIMGYCMSVGSLFWLILAEIFPLSIREQGASLAAGIQWLTNILVSLSFLSMLEYFGPSITFFIYSLICLSAMLFVHQFVPETKGLRLEKLQEL